MSKLLVENLGIKHGFTCIIIRQILCEMLENEGEGRC